MPPTIDRIAVVGAGFMGVQISSIAALSGNTVKVFDPGADAPARGIGEVKHIYALKGLSKKDKVLDVAQEKIHYSTSLPEAVADAELVIEAVSENLDLKRKVFEEIDRTAPDGALIASNSSSIPVTKLEDVVGRKAKVLNIHFDAPMMDQPLVDIMPGTETSAETIEAARLWVESIDCFPVVVKKPIMGYLGNRLWRMVKRESLKLWAEGFGDFMDIDRSWMMQFGVDLGPFAMMDAVGLDVVYDIEMAYYNESGDPADKPPEALKQMIDRGELGLKTGKGFYDWSAPAFLMPGFIKRKATQ